MSELGSSPKKSKKQVKSSIIASETLVKTIFTILDDHKAENVEIIDLKGKSDIADFMIVATGRSDRHIQSIADYVCKELKDLGLVYGLEGMSSRNWVLVDTDQVVVHIFTHESRDLYKLEDLWKD